MFSSRNVIKLKIQTQVCRDEGHCFLSYSHPVQQLWTKWITIHHVWTKSSDLAFQQLLYIFSCAIRLKCAIALTQVVFFAPMALNGWSWVTEQEWTTKAIALLSLSGHLTSDQWPHLSKSNQHFTCDIWWVFSFVRPLPFPYRCPKLGKNRIEVMQEKLKIML